MRALLLSLSLSLSLSLPCWAGASRDFDGANDSVNYGNIPNLSDSTALTCSLWMFLDATTADQAAILDYNTVDGSLFRYDDVSPENRTNTYGVFLAEGSGTANATVNTATDGAVISTWQFVTFSFLANSSTGLRIYVDGVEDANSPATTVNVDDAGLSNSGWFVGTDPNGGRDLNGKVAYAQCWNRVLSLTEIQQSMRFPGSITEGLQLYAPLWGDNPEVDLSGLGHAGTVSGSTAATDGPPVFLTSPLSWWRTFFNWFLPSAWADDIILCNPIDPTVPGRVSSYQRSADPFKSGAMANPNSLIWSLPPSPVRPWDGVAPSGSPDRWKCVDTDADAILDAVMAMSQVEQDALDAPAIAEAAIQQAFTDEQTTNNLCTATLQELTDRIDTMRDSLNADIMAATTIPQMKTVLTTMNTSYATVFKKIGRCIRARVR